MTLLEPALDPRQFDFARVNGTDASGSLSASGAGKVITITKMPHGLLVGNFLRISGGTGTAEAVAITAITGSGGDATGTVTVTTGNVHTGFWTIGSATAGIQEAIVAAPAYGEVKISAGASNLYATASTVASKQVAINGAGIAATALNLWFASGDGIMYDATTYALASIGNFRFDPQVTRTSGYDLHVKGATFGTVQNIYTRNTLNGFQFENCNSLQVDNLQVQSFTGNGFFLNASAAPTSGGFYSCLTAVGLGVNAMLIQASAGNAFAGTEFSDCNFQLATNLVNLFPNGGTLNEFLFANMILDTWGTRGMWFQGGSGSGNGVAVRGVRMGSSSGAGFGIGILSKWSNMLLSDITGGASGQGIVISGAKNIQISNSHISGDGSGAAGNVALTIQVDGATVADAIKVVNSSFGLAEDGTTGGGTATTGISITAAAHTNLRFFGNTAYGNATSGTSSFVNSATGAGSVATNNNFIGHTSPAVASAATLTFPAEQDYFTVTGTTGVTAVAGLIQGQSGMFVTTSGAVAFTASGTIGNSFTTTQNVPVNWAFDGTKVWLH